MRFHAGVPANGSVKTRPRWGQMGEVDYAPGEPKGHALAPHRGFETVTYMLDVIEISHQGLNSYSSGDS